MAAPAFAVYPPYTPDSDNQMVASAGSDTTFFLMKDIAQNQYAFGAPAGVQPQAVDDRVVTLEPFCGIGDNPRHQSPNQKVWPAVIKKDFTFLTDAPYCTDRTSGFPNDVTITTGSMTLTSPGGKFLASDGGKFVLTGGGIPNGSVFTFVSANTGTISKAATKTKSNATVYFGGQLDGVSVCTPPACNNNVPNGSSAGINALIAEAGSAKIEFARSSRGRGTAPAEASLEFWAYALDAVTWTHFGPSPDQPTNLTQVQLQNIYKCDPSALNWNQVGGTVSQPIIRYTAQAGSGTRSFFDTVVLNGQTSDNPACVPATIKVAESDGTLVAPGDKPGAILPYSFANWTAQLNGKSTDVRNGALLGSINGVAPGPSTIDETAAAAGSCVVPTADFCASRYVHNVVNPQLNTLHAADYRATENFIGVNNTTGDPGAVCDGRYASTISAFGFQPLPLGPTGGVVPGNSRCRAR
jgi:hypothetical protein